MIQTYRYLRSLLADQVQTSGNWQNPSMLYSYGHGMTAAHLSNCVGSTLGTGQPFSEALTYHCIGSGMPSPNGDSYFATFNGDDSAAISSDWNAVSADLWNGVKVAAQSSETIKQIFEEYLKLSAKSAPEQAQQALYSKQLELFSNER